MRIEAYNPVTKIYKTEKAGVAGKAENVASNRDEVQLSSFGRDYQIAKQAVAEASDIREDKVAAVSEKIKSGEYQVPVGDLADRLLQRYQASKI